MRDAVSWWRVGLADMHLVYERYSLPPGKCDLLTTVVEGPEASLRKFSETEWLWAERGLRLCDDRLFGTSGHVGVRNVNIFNGSTNLWTRIHYQGQPGGTEKMVSLEVQFPSAEMSGFLSGPLQGLSFPLGSLCDVLQEKSWIVEGTDKILGAECIRIRRDGKTEWMWLDLSHHAIPRRHFVQFGQGSGGDYVVDELQQLDGGLWFPKLARVQLQNPGEISNQLIVVTKAEVNLAIDPARFEPPTPEPATVVVDVRKGSARAVPAKVPEVSSLDADDSFSTAAPRSGKSWHWLLLGVPLVLVFLLRRIIVKSASL
ncbi:MAG: hypothetical protein JNM43_15170 [Planctomycetaceae bacterium]|nr:hypothetical protein [Planctomycetaceae bacterium]